MSENIGVTIGQIAALIYRVNSIEAFIRDKNIPSDTEIVRMFNIVSKDVKETLRLDISDLTLFGFNTLQQRCDKFTMLEEAYTLGVKSKTRKKTNQQK